MSALSISEALQKFLSESRIKDEMLAFQIADAWESIMGKTIARYTSQVRIQHGKLYIHTPIGPLRNELLYQREAILQKVNDYIGTVVVKEVVIQ